MTRVVLHVARGREWRGGEHQVFLLVEALAARDTIPQLVLTNRGSDLEHELRVARLPVAGIPWRIGWDPRALRALYRQVSGLQRDGQQPILHAHDSHALTLALAVARLRRVPVVATRRSITAPGAQWRRADQVVAISKAVAESLRDGGVPADRIIVAPSAVSPIHLKEPGTERPVTHPPMVVALGADTPEKGHHVLRQAISLLDPPRPRLTIMTSLDDAVLSEATLFVQPSLREALGTAVLVAMGRGLPVIASRTGGLIELLEGEAGLLVPPGDPGPLADAIRRLLADRELRDTLVRNARRRVEDYRPARMADQVTDVYASVHSEP